MNYKIHPLAEVQTQSIGDGTNIWQFCLVFKNAQIGNNCNICSHCLIENEVLIGNNVTVKSGVQLWDGLTIEDNVFIGPNVTFTNDLLPRSKNDDWIKIKTIIKNNASIGANSTILAGIEIGAFSMIGAGSVVTKSIPANTVWFGNPAVQKGFITKENVVLSAELIDPKTGERYFMKEGELIKFRQ